MTELRRFELTTVATILALLLVLSAPLVTLGHARTVGGLAAGALLGLANMAWMVGSARRLVGSTPTVRMLQVAAAFRFLTVAILFGAVLILTRVDPVGTVIGYACFPISAAIAGWRIFHVPGIAR